MVRYVRVEGAQVADIGVREAVGAAVAATYTASSHNDVYQAANVGDGNQATYWESTNNAFPQWLRADLGASVNRPRAAGGGLERAYADVGGEAQHERAELR
jgi:hypothetical protein